jgi:superfamily II DNA/RNA helicase
MQTLLFSATMGTSIDKLAAMSMRKPIRISADPENSTAEKLHQQIYKLTKDSETYREAALLTILTKVTEYTKKVIIFFKTKK